MCRIWECSSQLFLEDLEGKCPQTRKQENTSAGGTLGAERYSDIKVGEGCYFHENTLSEGVRHLPWNPWRSLLFKISRICRPSPKSLQ